MKIRTTKHLFREGIYGIWRNRLMSLAAIGTIVACLLIVGISYCIAANVDQILENIEETIGVTVYIEEDLPDEQRAQMQSQIEHMEYVAEVQYISKEQALHEFQQEMGEHSEILQGFEEDNPLPASFEVKLEDPIYQDTVVAQLQQLEGVELQFFDDETHILISINQSIRIVSLVLIGILAFIGILLMTNTIKLTVYIRRKEINIMKYIGATDWFIRWPFLIEGIVIGFMGAVIPLGVIWIGYDLAVQKLYENYPFIMKLFQFKDVQSIFVLLVPISLAIGIGIGILGSGISIRKHLKV